VAYPSGGCVIKVE